MSFIIYEMVTAMEHKKSKAKAHGKNEAEKPLFFVHI
jgi:hypothetical protein